MKENSLQKPKNEKLKYKYLIIFIKYMHLI